MLYRWIFSQIRKIVKIKNAILTVISLRVGGEGRLHLNPLHADGIVLIIVPKRASLRIRKTPFRRFMQHLNDK